jgi:hypothetical protein
LHKNSTAVAKPLTDMTFWSRQNFFIPSSFTTSVPVDSLLALYDTGSSSLKSRWIQNLLHPPGKGMMTEGTPIDFLKKWIFDIPADTFSSVHGHYY